VLALDAPSYRALRDATVDHWSLDRELAAAAVEYLWLIAVTLQLYVTGGRARNSMLPQPAIVRPKWWSEPREAEKPVPVSPAEFARLFPANAKGVSRGR
jgi:hypothetical protein